MDDDEYKKIMDMLGSHRNPLYQDREERQQMYRLCHRYEQKRARIPDTVLGIAQECPSWFAHLKK